MYFGKTKVSDAYLFDILTRKQKGSEISDLEEIIADFAFKLINASA